MLFIHAFTRIFLVLWSASIWADDTNTEIASIRNSVDDPNAFLKKDGPLVIMGNASLDTAKFVFLPEIHDDPKSLTTQLVLISREKQSRRQFKVLDESLDSRKKSMWDLFSQKTMEILVAKDHRRERQNYVPHNFEQALQNLATKFRAQHNQLNYLHDLGLWTLAQFTDLATPFYGWDSTKSTTLVARNVSLIGTLKQEEGNNDRILTMLGARHIPELEFLTSQQLLCDDSKSANIGAYFASLEKRFGTKPNLQYGIGATAPIFRYLSKKKYAIVFSRAFYKELDRIVAQFKTRLSPDGCMSLSR